MTVPDTIEQAPTPGGAVALVAQAVDALPALPHDDSRYGARRLTASWLYEQAPHTQRGYFTDLTRWLTWCNDRGLDPLHARPADVGEYRTALGEDAAPSTVARRMSAVSSWYRHLVANGAAAVNPVAGAKRPKVSRDESTTAGLTFDEAGKLLDAADGVTTRTGLRTRALLRMLAETGLRIGEALQLDVESLSHNQGYRTVRYVGKGGKQRERPLDGHTVEAIDAYLDDRQMRGFPRTGPLFATERADGTLGRLDEPAAFRLIRRMALAAGLKNAARLSPHSLRHAFATMALEEGVPLHDLQDAMGHADPRTTQRYNRGRSRLARDAALVVGRRFSARASTSSIDDQ